jgi:hypothetical protein
MLLTGMVLFLLQEDDVLRRRIKTYGLNNWSVVADGLTGRSGKSCSERCATRTAAQTNTRAQFAQHSSTEELIMCQEASISRISCSQYGCEAAALVCVG